ncbi:hypothetical protein K2173_021639 [Erythroxylum novogranatense]|uniref:Uncharacterized protein n=1 Tax=Erythroxylum novogranatense TaxID=1862640 RepID=A0AAV8TGX8_9ROSI|nr:hypothetical protein K2173_021639 [Erythroxylum novogranatense]
MLKEKHNSGGGDSSSVLPVFIAFNISDFTFSHLRLGPFPCHVSAYLELPQIHLSRNLITRNLFGVGELEELVFLKF